MGELIQEVHYLPNRSSRGGKNETNGVEENTNKIIKENVPEDMCF